MKRIFASLAVAVSTIALTGCLVPEKFTATVKVGNDGSYSYQYSGTTAFVPAIFELTKTGGTLSPKTEKDLQAMTGQISKSKDVQKATYEGKGRYDVIIAGVRKPGQQMALLDAFRIYTDKDGVINISSVAVKESDKAKLAELGLRINGKLSVTLPKNAEVLSTNATSSPTLFGLFGTYSWTIGSMEDRPVMKIRLR